MHRVHAYLAVTCHLHLWQNDRDLLHATAATQVGGAWVGGEGGGEWYQVRNKWCCWNVSLCLLVLLQVSAPILLQFVHVQRGILYMFHCAKGSYQFRVYFCISACCTHCAKDRTLAQQWIWSQGLTDCCLFGYRRWKRGKSTRKPTSPCRQRRSSILSGVLIMRWVQEVVYGFCHIVRNPDFEVSTGGHIVRNLHYEVSTGVVCGSAALSYPDFEVSTGSWLWLCLIVGILILS